MSGMSGKVVNRAGLELPRHHYERVIVGGGMMGLACAFYLRRLAPEGNLLVVEADGIPSEGGATFVSPAIAHRAFEDAETRARADWTLSVLERLSEETGVTRPHDLPFRGGGWARLSGAAERVAGLETLSLESFLTGLTEAQRTNLRHLIHLDEVGHVLYDPKGGYGSAEAVALHYGHGAVALGADLLLNARATFEGANRLRIERLEFNRYMGRERVRTESVEADTLIVAAGAETADWLEEALGVPLPLRKVYAQYPRIEADPRFHMLNGRVTMPVLDFAGFTLRPQGEGVLVVPSPLPPDPPDYTPTGGRVAGVRVGLRRELLDRLMNASDALLFVAWESLNLGKTVKRVRGAWEVVTKSGGPEWTRLENTSHYALVGGLEGFSLGLAVAYDLAATIHQVESRPWG